MNEVSLSKAAQFAVVGASSKGAVEAQSRNSGKDLPDQTVKSNEPVEPQKIKVNPERLETEVAQVNDFVQNVHRDLEFTVDKDLERTIIKVTDSESGEVIRQIPEDIFLELARRLKEDGELQLVNAQG